MKALQSITPGGPGTLQLVDVPVPVPGPGDVLVTIEACSINYPDVLIIEDKYQVRPPRPFSPGGEVAGTIRALGQNVTGFSLGDRVCGVTGYGGLAEAMTLPASKAFRMPVNMPFEHAAALLMTYGTSFHALVDRAYLQAGETLLVLGAAGGIGISAIEVGKALGARVIAAASSADKIKCCREQGADETLVYPPGALDRDAQRLLSEQFKSVLGPVGADVILDPVGGDYAEPALRAIAWEGRFLVVGFAAGIPKLPLNLPLLKGCDVLGVSLGGFGVRHPDHYRRNIEALFNLYGKGRIKPLISERYTLDRGGEAIARLAAREVTGKVIVLSQKS